MSHYPACFRESKDVQGIPDGATADRIILEQNGHSLKLRKEVYNRKGRVIERSRDRVITAITTGADGWPGIRSLGPGRSKVSKSCKPEHG